MDYIEFQILSMPSQSEIGITFNVYEIVSDGKEGDSVEKYGLEFIGSFETYFQAMNWIHVEGERKKDYTISEVIRKK